MAINGEPIRLNLSSTLRETPAREVVVLHVIVQRESLTIVHEVVPCLLEG
jgi:hypothetical protein